MCVELEVQDKCVQEIWVQQVGLFFGNIEIFLCQYFIELFVVYNMLLVDVFLLDIGIDVDWKLINFDQYSSKLLDLCCLEGQK